MNDLPARLTAFVGSLRGHGLRVGPSETVDAAAVLEVLGLEDREQARAGLAAALLRAEHQRPVFDAAFDLYFPLGVGELEQTRSSGGEQAEEDQRAITERLRDRLAQALAADDRAALAQLAGEAVAQLGRYGAGGAGGAGGNGGWSAHQTLSRLQPETLLARVRDARAGTGFADRLNADEVRRRIAAFRAQIGAEARRRVAEVRGAELVAARALPTPVDRLDLTLAGAAQQEELRRLLPALARQLATRLAARRRRAARGTVDIRRTLRRSLSTGGVPVSPAYRRRSPARPDLVLLCDVSGSVAGFASFTMALAKAMDDQFSRLRVFAFVNRTDEVTRLVADTAEPAELSRRILAEARVGGYHGSSDYGSALGEFAERHLDAVGPRTTVLVLGDARTNGFDPNLPALHRIADRAHRVFWLNPEGEANWGTGDSAALGYAGVVPMHVCRSVRGLAELLPRLLPTG